ncbi:MAG TPA: SEL1-like repeat protein, partial [Devosia sp.]
MSKTSSLTTILVRLAMLGVIGLAPVQAQEVDAALDAAAIRYKAEAAELAQLEAATDPESRIKLAQRLAQGTMTGPANPLPRFDLDRAESLLDEIIAGGDPKHQQRALSLKADILGRRGTPEAAAARDRIKLDLARNGYAPAIADLVVAGGALPSPLTEETAIAALETRVLEGDRKATAALSTLLAARDPERSRSLQAQAQMLNLAAAETDAKAASVLGRSYLEGTGVAADSAEGLRLLKQAAAGGDRDAVRALDRAVRDKVPGLEPDT